MKRNRSVIARLAILMFICLVYPYIKLKTTNSTVAFIDSLTIEGLVLLIIGISTSIIHSDIYRPVKYIIQKKFYNYNNSYETFVKDISDTKTFNYALYLGLYCVTLSIILSLFQ